MKEVFTRRNSIKLFGIKVFESVVNFNSRATDRDDEENRFYIDLREFINENKG